MKSPIAIGFLTKRNPEIHRLWSGTHRSIYFALQAQFQSVIPIYSRRGVWLEKVLYWWSRVWLKLTGKNYKYQYEPALVALYRRDFDRQLKRHSVQCLFVSLALPEVANISSSVPVILLTDALLEQLYGCYPGHSQLTARSAAHGLSFERRALARAAHVVLCSEWSLAAAVQAYGLANSSCSVVPFGANMSALPSGDEVATMIDARVRSKQIKLLWVGVEWERKGGALAVAVADLLHLMGEPVELTIIGSIVPSTIQRKYITNIPFLDKGVPEQFARLQRLFAESSFFLLPAKNECFGIVYAEAAAFGLPSLALRSGGASTAVQDFESGFLFDEGVNADEIVNRILTLNTSLTQYIALCRSSRLYYEQVVNWQSWGAHARAIIEKSVR